MANLHDVKNLLDLPLWILNNILKEDGVLVYLLVPLVVEDLKIMIETL